MEKYLSKFMQRIDSRDKKRVDITITFVSEFIRNMCFVTGGAVTYAAIVTTQLIPNKTVEFFFAVLLMTTVTMELELFALSFHRWLDERSEEIEEQ